MKEKIIELKMEIYKTVELLDDDARLRSLAIEAAQHAYAPYSGFYVGTVVLFEGGAYVIGNNQENAAYPSGLCAERVALFSAGANLPDKIIRALAIVAIKGDDIQKSVSPCGACRQVMLETEQRNGKEIRILLCGCDETVIVSSAKDLLPLYFSKMDL